MSSTTVQRRSKPPRAKDQRQFLLVCARPCDQCLFSSRKIVDDERRDEVLASCDRRDKPFVCHKHSIRAGKTRGVARAEAQRTACHGYWQRFRGARLVFRLADQLGLVRFVDEDGQIVRGDHD